MIEKKLRAEEVLKSFLGILLVFGYIHAPACKAKVVEDTIPRISDQELSSISEIKKIIDEVPPPKKIAIRRLLWRDIENLNAVPPEDGGSLKAREGDIYIETENIRAVIQAPGRELGPFTYGGNLIDIDLKREDESFRDILGEENLFVFMGHTLKPKKVGLYRNNVLVAIGELDILDYINATGLAEMIRNFLPSFNLPYAVDEVKPFRVEKYFVFSDGRWLKIIDVLCNTSERNVPYFFFADMIDSGGSGEFYIPSSPLKGYGYSYPGMPLGMGIFSAEYLGFVSEELEASYAIFPTGISNLVLIVSGVAIFVYNVLEKEPISSLIRLVLGNSDRLITVEPKKCIYNEKHFIVGNASPSSLTDEFFRIRNEKVFSVSGTIRAGNLHLFPERPRIAVFDQSSKLVTSVIADRRGRFSLILPRGEYIFVAEAKFSRPSEAKKVVVEKDLKDMLLDLEEPAEISVSVVEITEEGSERSIPAKISVLCKETCPKRLCLENCDFPSSSFRDVTFDPLPEGVQEVVFASGLQTKIYVPAGKYKIVVSRGMEYSRYEKDVELRSGESLNIRAALHRVSDARGWLSADTHVHSVNSPDSPVSLKERVITFGGEGVEILISTDHDWLTDYEPAIISLGFQEFVASIVGQEITTFTAGHFNAYPLKINRFLPSGGAIDWSDKYDRPEKYGISAAERENYRFLRALHPREIFRSARLMKPEVYRRNIVQMNHPRSGYIEFLRVDTLTLKTDANPCVHRIFPPLGVCGSSKDLGEDDTKLFIPVDVLKDLNHPERFDTLEIYNSYSEITAVINDWFSLLNHGIHVTAVGCSDSHRKISNISGIGRTFVWVGEGRDHPALFRSDIETQNIFIDNLVDGKVFVSNGIILERIELCGYEGSSERCIPPGRSEMRRISPPFKLKVAVKSAEWVDFDVLRVFINSRKTAARGGHRVVGFPQAAVEEKIEPETEQISVRNINFKRKYFKREIQVNPPDEDFWLVLVIECSPERCGEGRNPMFPVIPDKNERPILITNPIYVDFDGDGKFSPAPPTYGDDKISTFTSPKSKVNSGVLNKKITRN